MSAISVISQGWDAMTSDTTVTTPTDTASVPTAPPHYQTGDSVGPFIIEEVPFCGSMSEVYFGRHPLGYRVVLKRARSPEYLDEIQNELDILNQLCNRHISKLVSPVLVDDCIVMEFAEIGTVDNHFLTSANTGSDPTCLLLDIARFSLTGLNYLHSKRILHRDLKPGNILVSFKDGLTSVMLSDFGISMHVDISDPSTTLPPLHTVTTHFSGTQMFAAPESLRPHEAHYSAASDVWSWACTIATLATGKYPTTSQSGTFVIPYSRAELDNGPLSGEMADIVFSCFVEDPNSRPLPQQLLDRFVKFKRPCYIDLLSREPDSMPVSARAIVWSNLGGSITPRDTVAVNGATYTRLQCFVKALTLDPSCGIFWCNVSFSLAPRETVEINGELYTSIQCCCEALARTPHYSMAWSNLGSSMEEIEMTEEEVVIVGGREFTQRGCFEQAIMCDPRNALSWCNLGYVMKPNDVSTMWDMPFTAAQCCVRSLEIRPDDPVTWDTLGLALVGDQTITFNSVTFTKQACFVKALELDPSSAQQWEHLAGTLHESEQVTVCGKSVNIECCHDNMRKYEGDIHEYVH